MSAKNVLNAAIYNQLRNGTALIAALGGTARTDFPGGVAIAYEIAPDEANKPFVLFSWQAGGDENITPNRTKNLVLLVRSFAGTASQAGTIDKLVDDRLHMQTLSVSGWTNFWTARENDISLVENLPNVVKSYMEGGQYRVRVDSNS